MYKRQVYHKFLHENLGVSSIARYLNNSCIKTGTGNTWCPKTVKYILQNPFYIGFIRWDYQPSDVTGRHVNEDYMTIKGQHTPIIDEETFKLCQEKLKLMTATNGGKRTYTEPRKHWLSGMVKCSSCGGSLGYGSKGHGRKPMFRCINYGKGRCNCSNGITAERLENAVIEGLQNAIATNSYHIVSQHQDNTEIDTINDALKMLPMKEERIRLAYMDGIDTLDDYRYNKELLKKEKNSLEERLRDLENSKQNTDVDLGKEIISSVQLLSDENIPDSQKSMALKAICQKIVYDKKSQTLDFYLVRE